MSEFWQAVANYAKKPASALVAQSDESGAKRVEGACVRGCC